MSDPSFTLHTTLTLAQVYNVLSNMTAPRDEVGGYGHFGRHLVTVGLGQHKLKDNPRVLEEDCFYGWGKQLQPDCVKGHTLVTSQDLGGLIKLAERIIESYSREVVITFESDWNSQLSGVPILYLAKHVH